MDACAASASANPRVQNPVARSTLLLAKLPREQLGVLDSCAGPELEGDDVLRYGQKIQLLANPAAQQVRVTAGKWRVCLWLYGTCSTPCTCPTHWQGLECDATTGSPRPLALYSSRVTPTCAARSQHQLVGFTWQEHTFDSVWQVCVPEQKFLLKHRATVPALCRVCCTQCCQALLHAHTHCRRCSPWTQHTCWQPRVSLCRRACPSCWCTAPRRHPSRSMQVRCAGQCASYEHGI